MSRQFGLPNPEAPFDDELDAHWREPPPTASGWWSLVVVFVAAVLIGLAVYSCSARAHMHDRPDLTQWLMSLSSKHRGPCCDSTEAETMADPDWRSASEMKKGEKCEGEEVAEAVYCVRLENPDRRGEWAWWAVSDDAVVEEPNRAGPALIWMDWQRIDRGGLVTAKPFIRCFLPGPLT